MFFNKQQDLPQRRAPHAEACALPVERGRVELNNPKLQPRSLIDRSANMIGDLWSEGDIQIDGHLCGNINCAQLLVGKDAVITGAVIAQEAVIRGKMTGLIRATRVLLQASARVGSEIIYQSLSVVEGASFEGFARPQANPLAEASALTPIAQGRGRTAGAEEGAGPRSDTLAPSETSPEPLRALEHAAAGGL